METLNLKGRKVWVVREQHGVSVFTNEQDARKRWLNEVEYCKSHTKETQDDRWVYDVWHVTDEDITHYACVTSRDSHGLERRFSLYYGEQYIQ